MIGQVRVRQKLPASRFKLPTQYVNIAKTLRIRNFYNSRLITKTLSGLSIPILG